MRERLPLRLDVGLAMVLDVDEFTPFQRRVYDVVGTIERGTVRTYGNIAKELGTSARAVGNAMGRSPGPSDTLP